MVEMSFGARRLIARSLQIGLPITGFAGGIHVSNTDRVMHNFTPGYWIFPVVFAALGALIGCCAAISLMESVRPPEAKPKKTARPPGNEGPGH